MPFKRQLYLAVLDELRRYCDGPLPPAQLKRPSRNGPAASPCPVAGATMPARKRRGRFMLDTDRLGKLIDQCWGDAVVPTLVEYIKIPNKSPSFDPQWAEHGYMDDAVKLFEGWARERLQALPGATLEIVRLPGRTPLMLIEVPANGARGQADTVLLYGHLDKQPEMVGWAEGYGPWMPRIDGDKLYGRGGADDGYAMFGALTALLGLRDQRAPHARCVILIEACEESGSYDLPHYIEHLADRIGRPSLVICLDSGCGNYDQLWMTTSLRGIAAGTLTVEVLDRRRAFGPRLRGRAVELPHPANAAVASRGREQRGDPAARALCPGPARADRAGARRRGGAGRHGVYRISVRGGCQADGRRSRRTRAEPHLAAAARGHRHRRAAEAGRRRQCAAALHDREAEPAPAADPRMPKPPGRR